MTRFYKTPYLVKKAYPSLHWNTNVGDTVHLTFDDGPDLTVTPWVLDQLDRVGAKATFFCIGKKVIEHRDLIRGMMETGHRIANHTHDHLKGTQTSASAYVANVAKCAKELERLGSQNKLFRPPYGKIKRSQIQRLKGMKVVMWSHLSYDFDQKVNVKKSIAALKRAKGGSIVVFHDSQKAFSNLKLILPEVLAHYDQNGLKMKTLS